MPVNQVKRNGSYAPLSAHYYKNDKLAAVGERAELLYIRGLAFCADVLEDGFISDLQLTRFPGVGMTGIPARAKALVEVGLWERVEGGYNVVGWAKWNLTKAEIRNRQQKDADRKAGIK